MCCPACVYRLFLHMQDLVTYVYVIVSIHVFHSGFVTPVIRLSLLWVFPVAALTTGLVSKLNPNQWQTYEIQRTVTNLGCGRSMREGPEHQVSLPLWKGADWMEAPKLRKCVQPGRRDDWLPASEKNPVPSSSESGEWANMRKPFFSPSHSNTRSTVYIYIYKKNTYLSPSTYGSL